MTKATALVIIVLPFILQIFGNLAHGASDEIAVINFNKLKEYLLNKEMDALQKEEQYSELVTEFKRLESEGENLISLYSQEKSDEIDDGEIFEEHQERLNTIRQRMLEITKVFNDKRKELAKSALPRYEKRVGVIIDDLINSGQIGILIESKYILFTREKYDITPKIIDILKSQSQSLN